MAKKQDKTIMPACPLELEEFYENLAMAIIRHAVNDYERVLVQLFFHPTSKRKIQLYICKAHLEAYFHSKEYTQLTDVDGDYVIQQARKRAVAIAKRKIQKKHQNKIAELEGKKKKKGAAA